MPTDMTKKWDERREALLSDLCELFNDLGEGKIPHVCTDLNHVYVHFFDEEDEDIGHLYAGRGLHALNSDVYLWQEASTAQDENGEPLADLDIREAVRVELHSH